MIFYYILCVRNSIVYKLKNYEKLSFINVFYDEARFSVLWITK